MNIETKYNIGDKVFIIRDNKIQEKTIDAIMTHNTETTRGRRQSVTYGFSGQETFSAKEKELYPTKIALLEAL